MRLRASELRNVRRVCTSECAKYSSHSRSCLERAVGNGVISSCSQKRRTRAERFSSIRHWCDRATSPMLASLSGPDKIQPSVIFCVTGSKRPPLRSPRPSMTAYTSAPSKISTGSVARKSGSANSRSRMCGQVLARVSNPPAYAVNRRSTSAESEIDSSLILGESVNATRWVTVSSTSGDARLLVADPVDGYRYGRTR